MPNHLHGLFWLHPHQAEQPSVSAIIRAYKSLVSKQWTQHVHEQDNPLENIEIWQRSFYDTIIKNKQHLIRTRFYIINNPLMALKEQGNITRKNMKMGNTFEKTSVPLSYNQSLNYIVEALLPAPPLYSTYVE